MHRRQRQIESVQKLYIWQLLCDTYFDKEEFSFIILFIHFMFDCSMNNDVDK